ncbi:hypothetical protein [Microvirga alba]|uniref:Uncharacterized protein n=1 Tax=Microvirga alba TaxID=2791025 RepID=A0A931FQB7_9HYPH|nr:hypothetical protein [Microvirga alba]MBF9234442.1 hypothetical protein [Microvirga alba]
MARRKPYPSALDPVIEEARRNRNLLRGLPRVDRLNSLYVFALHQWPLMAEWREGGKAFPIGKVPLTRDELILFALALRDFDMNKVRERIAENRMHLTEAERDYHSRRRQAQAQEVAASWSSRDAQRALGLDEETCQFISHIWATRTARALYNLLQEMHDRSAEFLHPASGPFSIWVKRENGPARRALRIEEARSHWLKRRRALQTALLAAIRLQRAIQSLPVGVREILFDYFGASALGKKLTRSLHTTHAAKILTACIIAAERLNAGPSRFVADDRLRKDILAAI